MSTQIQYVKDIAILKKALDLVAPIASLVVMNEKDPSTWEVTFRPTATLTQIANANALIANFDLQEAESAIEDHEEQQNALNEMPFRLGDLYNILLDKGVINVSEAELGSPGITALLNKQSNLKGKKL